jgi:hypothetical protein
LLRILVTPIPIATIAIASATPATATGTADRLEVLALLTVPNCALVCTIPEAAAAATGATVAMGACDPLASTRRPGKLASLDRTTRAMRSAIALDSGPPRGASAIASAPASA